MLLSLQKGDVSLIYPVTKFNSSGHNDECDKKWNEWKTWVYFRGFWITDVAFLTSTTRLINIYFKGFSTCCKVKVVSKKLTNNFVGFFVGLKQFEVQESCFCYFTVLCLTICIVVWVLSWKTFHFIIKFLSLRL